MGERPAGGSLRVYKVLAFSNSYFGNPSSPSSLAAITGSIATVAIAKYCQGQVFSKNGRNISLFKSAKSSCDWRCSSKGSSTCLVSQTISTRQHTYKQKFMSNTKDREQTYEHQNSSKRHLAQKISPVLMYEINMTQQEPKKHYSSLYRWDEEQFQALKPTTTHNEPTLWWPLPQQAIAVQP